jgi:hypothetical protein
MTFNEALIANSQLKLFAVLAGVVFALLSLTFTQLIALFFELSHLFCFMKMIMSFAKNKLTFYKIFLAFSYPKSWISLLFSCIVFQHTQKIIFTDLSNEIASSNTAYIIINATV